MAYWRLCKRFGRGEHDLRRATQCAHSGPGREGSTQTHGRCLVEHGPERCIASAVAAEDARWHSGARSDGGRRPGVMLSYADGMREVSETVEDRERDTRKRYRPDAILE